MMDTELFRAPLDLVTALGFAMPRFLGVFTILPLLSSAVLPMTLRMGVVSCFGAFLVPALLEGTSQPHTAVELIIILVRESALGALIGFVLAVPLWAVEAMGDIADTQRGANIAQTLNPLSGHETSPLGQLFNQAIVTFLFATGGFILVLSVVYDSYRIWPVFGHWPGFGPDAGTVLLGQLDSLMRLTVLLAAPVVFSMFIAECGLAIVSRFVPQLQVFFLAMPVKSGIAMIVFAVYVGVMFDTAHSIMHDTFDTVLNTVGTVIKPGTAR
jgi:type III secretion protein T